jgi:hypothetical protein
MIEVIKDDKFLIYFFHASLSHIVFSLYMIFNGGKIKKLKDMVEAFICQYKINLEVVLIRSNL